MINIKTSHDSETQAQGQQVITACAFIHANFDGEEKLFMPKRALTKKFLPGVFELPGGHIDYGEDIVVGLKRELQEEFSMEIIVGDPFYAFTYLNEVKGSHSIEVIYFAKFVGDFSQLKVNPEDHSEFIWLAEDEMAKVLQADKDEDDLEVMGIRRGFELMRTGTLNLG